MAEREHLFASIARSVRLGPNRPAIIFGTQSVSYEVLWNAASSIGSQLHSLGIAPADPVAVLLPTCPEMLVAFMGLGRIRAVIVPVYWESSSEEVHQILRSVGARVLLTTTEGRERHMKVIEELGVQPIVLQENAEPLRRWDLPEIAIVQESLPAPDDVAAIIHTSGTTGGPKGVVLSQGYFSAIGAIICAGYGLGAADRMLSAVPLHTVFGWGAIAVPMLMSGGTIVMAPRFTPAIALDLMARHRVSFMFGVPTMFAMMLNFEEREKFTLDGLRLCVAGGSVLPPELVRRWEEETGVPLLNYYGSTEAAALAFERPFDRRPGSIGTCGIGIQLRIVDEQFRDVPENAVGEIIASGPTTMLRYHAQPEMTAHVKRGEWVGTGDLGYRDAEGYFYVSGRKKDIVIRGGANVSTSEVESVLLRHLDISEAAVVGVPDDVFGERIKACLIARSGARLVADDIRSFCAKHLSDYKVPELIEIWTEFPRNATGKILKTALKHQHPK